MTRFARTLYAAWREWRLGRQRWTLVDSNTRTPS